MTSQSFRDIFKMMGRPHSKAVTTAATRLAGLSDFFSTFARAAIRDRQDPAIQEDSAILIARFNFEARFGHKQNVIELMKQWDKEIGSQIGWKDDKIRSLTGSIGAKESLVQRELTSESIAYLEQGFQKLANVKGHSEWGKQLEEHVVSGSNVW